MSDKKKENSTIQEMLNIDLYKQMKRTWMKLFLIWLLAEVVGASCIIVLHLIDYRLPMLFDIQSADFSATASNLFTTTITVNGIVIGFASVCAFFYLGWVIGRIDKFSERQDQLMDSENENQDQPKRNPITNKVYERLELLHDVFWKLWYDTSRYIKLYIEISLLLIILQVAFFFLEIVSGIFLILTSILSINSLVMVASGLYPVMRRVLWQPSTQ